MISLWNGTLPLALFSTIKNDTNILCRLWLYHNVVREKNSGKNVNRQDSRAQHTPLNFKKRGNRGCYCFPNLVRLLLSQARVEHEKCENFCPSWLCHYFTRTVVLREMFQMSSKMNSWLEIPFFCTDFMLFSPHIVFALITSFEGV